MDERTDAMINELRAQRNNALDMVANASGLIAELRARVQELEANAKTSAPAAD